MESRKSVERRGVRTGSEYPHLGGADCAGAGNLESAGTQRLGLSAGWTRAGWLRAAAALAAAVSLTGAVIPKHDKLTDDEKIEILRNLTAENAKAKTYLPQSKTPLEFDVNGTW